MNVLDIDVGKNGGEEVVHKLRKTIGARSRQPRFNLKDPDKFFMSVFNWVQKAELQEKKYRPDSRSRDAWLREFVKLEPFLNGVLNSVVDIDKNRGWSVVGGRNQVLRIRDMLHNFEVAPGYRGWRPGISFSSQAYWGSDINCIVELGRDGVGGPITQLYTVDPSTCYLTGSSDKPLAYVPTAGSKRAKQYWSYDDYFRVGSAISTDERYNGLGMCAVSRCLELAKIMIAIYEHDREQLGAQAPRGLLMLKGFTRKQWDDAMRTRDAELSGDDLEYYGALAVLASNAQSIDAKMIALSNLPLGFNLREWVDMLLYGYALCFGFDAAEFIPVQFGALGRGTEQEIQHEKATGKGRLDFVLGFQEQLQFCLPDSIQFLFDQRDDKGDMIKAEVNQKRADVAKTLYEAGSSNAEGSLLSRDETRVLLADYGVIPREWTEVKSISATDKENEENETMDADMEDVEVEAEKEAPVEEVIKPKEASRVVRFLRDQYRESPYVFRAAQKYPKDPIVRYMYPDNISVVLWESGEDALKQSLWTGVSL